MNGSQKGFLLVVLLGVGGYVGYQNFDFGGSTPAGTPGKVSAAWKALGNDYADAYDALAASPPKTVLEADKLADEKLTAARAKFRKTLAEILEPEIGAKDLDPAKAKVFAELAKGVRRK